MNDKSVLLTNFGTPNFMLNLLPDKYRACNKTDTVEIRRDPECEFNPEPTTIPREFKRCCSEYNCIPAIVSKEGETYTFKDYYNNALLFAKAAVKCGLQMKDTVTFIGFNSPEYHFGLHGTWLAGGITAGIYTTNNEDSCKYVLSHSETVICVCQSGKQLSKILAIRDQLPLLKIIVSYWQDELLPIFHDGFAQCYSWEDFLKLGMDVPDNIIDDRINSVVPGSCATIIYTSGTTGDPKGVMCSHDNCTYNALAVKGVFGLCGVERMVGFLPLNHVAAQYVDCLVFLYNPMTIFMAEPDALSGSLINTLKKAQPTIFVSVPRVYEKMMERIKITLAEKEGFALKFVNWARRVGMSYVTSTQFKHKPKRPFGFWLANKFFFKRIREQLGLSAVHIAVASAANLTEDTLEFFASLNIPIMDLLGQSEGTAPVTTCTNVDQQWKMGTVGLPFPGVDLTVNADSEIMYKGRNVMMGYLKQPEETLKAIDDEGFLHTGDMGTIDKDGFLTVTGRLKEQIVNTKGERISPVGIENRIMELSPIISSCIVVGHKRDYLSILICLRCDLDEEGESTHRLTKETVAFLEELGTDVQTVEQAINDSTVKKYINGILAKYNKGVSAQSYLIRNWCILLNEFTVGNGELTATMKLRRSVVQQHYAKEIDSLY